MKHHSSNIFINVIYILNLGGKHQHALSSNAIPGFYIFFPSPPNLNNQNPIIMNNQTFFPWYGDPEEEPR